MWLWLFLWHASIILVGGTLDYGFFTQKRHYGPTPEVHCYEYSKLKSNKIGKYYNEGIGWRQKTSFSEKLFSASSFPIKLKTNGVISRRFDILLPKTDEIVKEHAKLVQDINGLRQVVFVAPFRDDNRDYDDSIFPETIETSTSPGPTTYKTPLMVTKASSIPVILLGGASHRQVVKSQPIQFSKPTISLIGTTASPVKHPYPFVMQESSRRPFKVCMTSMPVMYTTTTRRPSLWERLLNYIIPR